MFRSMNAVIQSSLSQGIQQLAEHRYPLQEQTIASLVALVSKYC